ncbi:unnamed protein product [Macrosiphum euphorbiae]|uniref:Tc1-like transposase DDE domain-containing protein n=1 Tax=Macrosiphum euphorbiae TaxID=13131 RepID=A0AAV0Y1S7_9HEMI|nr:unnamed protein product [Macrosiphum euphorbiae]
MDLVDISPSKKNPRGKFVGTGQKQIIINLYKDKIKQQQENPDGPKLTYRQMLLEISKSSGIGQRTIQTTLAEYKKKVMDNAAYHSVKKDRIPVMSWKKQEIINWLESKGENITYPTTKGALLSKVRTIHTDDHEKYVIDEYAKDNNKTVLRLPPYHCELNPIELAWSSVKRYVRTHNTTFKLKDVKELLKRGVELVTPEMWTNFVGHVIKEEEKFWKIDNITDDFMDEEPEEGARHILTIGDTSSDSDSD